MGAALTIAVLLVLSVTVVRISAVAMRLTGLPETVARFQCISALTGTGFTTHESEMIVNYPIRRRVLVGLMILGNFGLVSVGSTFIVTFVNAGGDTQALKMQLLAFVLAIGLTMFVTMNKTLDRTMCGFIGFLLMKFTSLGHRRYKRVLQLDNGFSVAEHVIAGGQEKKVGKLGLKTVALTLLTIRGKKAVHHQNIKDNVVVSPGDILVCYGAEKAHDRFEDEHNQSNAPDAKGAAA